MIVEQLEGIIRSHVALPSPSSSGWCSVRCLVCNDHNNKRRGGWKFDSGSIGYHCFNCGAKFVVDNETKKLSDETIRILNSYGIGDSELGSLRLTLLTNRSSVSKRESKSLITYPKPIEMPAYFVPLSESTSIWRDVALEYLDERGVDPSVHPFHICEKSTNLTHKQWFGRLILPVYRDKGVIFWQGRDMTGTKQPKYLNPPVSRESILFGYDKLYTSLDQPLYVVEGMFDALTVNGVAVFSNKLTPSQIDILSRSPRRKVVIPDKSGSGDVIAKQALDQGWEISIPDYGNCKDPSEAKAKYGLLYVMRAITEGTATATRAKIALAHLIK